MNKKQTRPAPRLAGEDDNSLWTLELLSFGRRAGLVSVKGFGLVAGHEEIDRESLTCTMGLATSVSETNEIENAELTVRLWVGLACFKANP